MGAGVTRLVGVPGARRLEGRIVRQHRGPWASAVCVVPWPANFSTLVIRITRSFSGMAIPLG